MYAGGKNANNTSYYLYNGQNYWTMSPDYWYYYSSSNLNINVFHVHLSGYLSDWGVTYTYGVRPVINLNANINLSGNGTMNDPYEVI